MTPPSPAKKRKKKKPTTLTKCRSRILRLSTFIIKKRRHSDYSTRHSNPFPRYGYECLSSVQDITPLHHHHHHPSTSWPPPPQPPHRPPPRLPPPRVSHVLRSRRVQRFRFDDGQTASPSGRRIGHGGQAALLLADTSLGR